MIWRADVDNPISMKTSGLLIRGCLSGVLLLQLLGGFFAGPSLWAVNHLAYAPYAVRLAWPLLGLLLIWSPAAGTIGRWMTTGFTARFFGRSVLVYGAAPLLAVVVFWFARCRTHFLGDGWLLGEGIAGGVPFHGYEFITYHLHARLFAAMGLSGEQQAYSLFAATSIVSGGIYVAVAGWGARRLTADPAGRALIYTLVMVCSPLLMFMGYVECYAPLAVALLAFFFSLVLYYQGKFTGRSPILIPAACYGLALFLHLDALFVAPLLLLLVLVAPAVGRGAWVNRLLIVAGCCLTALLLAGVIYYAGGYDRAAYEADFGSGRGTERVFASWKGEQGLLSLTHWKDMGNLLLLLIPVPLGLVISRYRRWPESREEGVLLAGGLWLILFISLVNMKLGVVRDWDLFAAPVLLFCVLAGLAWLRDIPSKESRPILGAIVTTAVILILPWVWINAGEARALRRFRDVMTDQSAYAQAYGHEEMGKYLRREGRIGEALAEYRTSMQLRPDNTRRLAVLAGMLYNNGAKEESFAAFQRILQIDVEHPLALEMLARLHVEREEANLALPYARKLAGRPEETHQAASLHGQAAERANQPRESLEAFERAYALRPDRIDYLERAGGLALVLGEFRKSEQYFRRALQMDPGAIAARAGLVMTLWAPIRERPESWNDPLTRQRMEEALALIDRMPPDGETGQMAGSWQREIRAALAGEKP